MKRPTHRVTVEALRTTDPRFPWVHPTPEEDDIAAVLEAVEQEHQGEADAPDDRGKWGDCTACGTPWPCERWAWAEHLVAQWLGRAADRVWAHAESVMRGLDERERTRSARPNFEESR